MTLTPDHLDTPEKLDRTLYVTTPRAWLALCALLAMMAAVTAWAFLGSVSTYVRGDGIVLSHGGAVFDASSAGGGKLMRIVPAVGDSVSGGEVVADVFDEETMERYASARALTEERRRTLREREAEAEEENALAGANLAKQLANLDELERTDRELVDVARRRLTRNNRLFEEGIVALSAVEEAEESLDLARHNLFEVLRRRDDLHSADLRRRNQLKIRLAAANEAFLEAERRMREIGTKIETLRVRAPVSGRVIEFKAQVGARLVPGQPVLSIETGGEGLDVLVYVPHTDGKRIRPGMAVLVTPRTVRQTESGSMIGAVARISEFPVSLQGMTAALQNQELAATLSRGGPPYSGRVALKPDPTTASGFAWTSPRGREIEISAGTLAGIEIEVEKQAPVTLIVPLIKGKLDL